MTIDAEKKPLLKYKKRVIKMIPFAGIFLFAFVLGWIVSLTQAYKSFSDHKHEKRELYSDKFNLNIFPLTIDVKYTYLTAENDYRPEKYNSLVSVKWNDLIIYPYYADYPFRTNEEAEDFSRCYIPHEPFIRTGYFEDEIKKIRYKGDNEPPEKGK